KGKSPRPGLWKCKDCRTQFSVTVGTVFERSKIPLNKWLMAVHLMCASKKAISSHQIHRMLGVTYKSAWFMTHRIREAMTSENGGLLGTGGGTVEVDETYWGNNGKQRKGARGYQHKMKIVSLVERDGEKRSMVVKAVTGKTLREVLHKNVCKSAHLMTDEHAGYTKAGREYASHGVTRHSAGQYVDGINHSNTVESSFSLLKRGLVGTFHHVGEQHLQRYCTEFDFRWNHRKVCDADRASFLLGQVGGKRLQYKQPV
ncbi:MAG: IS1595 family transposase, partial [Alphaproteobacteria bacterium]|nr:IS1595 family transposase [Alphaproteobacteria bacterium]